MKKVRCVEFRVIGVMLGLVLTSVTAQAVPKPNIVHILVDDLGWQDIASHKVDGKPVYETPHLDRMTKMGRRFTQAYSPSPTCAPSRVAFLRGQYPVNTGVYHVVGGQIPRPANENNSHMPPFYRYGLPVDEPMIPEVLKKAGYVSGHVGKWHAGGKSAGYPFPIDQGFDFGFTEKNRRKSYNDADLWRPDEKIKNTFFGTWSVMKPDRLSDFATHDPEDPFQLDDEERPFDKPLALALGFMDKYKSDPFFLNFAPYYVHGPIGTRNRERLAHYCKKMGYDFPTDPGVINRGKQGQSNPYYASMVDTVDWMVGKVIHFLATTDDPRNPGHKLIDNTYIMISSDNGGWTGNDNKPITDNRPLRAGKMSVYEGGIRIPFVVRGPGVEAHSSCDVPISLIDLFPTFMAMADLAPSDDLELDGCNILPLMRGESDRAVQLDGRERQSIYWYYPIESHMAFAMRKGDWKILRNFNRGEEVELFRLYNADGSPNDLGESVNLADTHPEVRDMMLAELDEFIERAGAPMPYKSASTASRDAESKQRPGIVELGAEMDVVWATFETGPGKAEIVDAQLVYTLNPPLLEETGGARQEWFSADAKILGGRVEATMPPGATHAVFCMRDANNFYVSSEPMPSFREVPMGNSVKLLKNGYAYRPGLFALIKLGQQAQKSAEKAGLDVAALKAALNTAKVQVKAEPIQEKTMCDAIRSLRAAIRNLKGTPEAAHPLINRFPTDPLY